MTQMSEPLWRMLEQALVSLAAWHVLEGLGRLPAHRANLGELVTATGLDLGQATSAVDTLCERGLLQADPDGTWHFAPQQEADWLSICARVDADRDLQRRVVIVAARRDALELRVSWAPGSSAAAPGESPVPRPASPGPGQRG